MFTVYFDVNQVLAKRFAKSRVKISCCKIASNQYKIICSFFSFICKIDDGKSIENDDRKSVLLASRL